tara:strand:+ start:49 stop:282 length:234 start_codon:yes stop_codon:yes gene_type:complete
MKNLTQPQQNLLTKMIESNTGFYFQWDSEKRKPIHPNLKTYERFLHNREQNTAYKLEDKGLIRTESIKGRDIWFVNK